MRYYDARLLGYLALLDLPLQKAIKNFYLDSPPTSNRASASALIYTSAQALTLLSAKYIFETMHDVDIKSASQYYVLPTTEYTYNRHKEFVKTQPLEQRDLLNKRADALLNSAPRYSKSLVDITSTAYCAKLVFGTLVGYQIYKNPIKGLLFGAFVPMAVVFEEQKAHNQKRES